MPERSSNPAAPPPPSPGARPPMGPTPPPRGPRHVARTTGAPPPRSSAWRRFWLVGGAALTVVVVVFTALQVVSWIAREDLRVGRTFTSEELAGVRVVEIRNSAGGVDVIGSDTSEVRVDASGSRGLFETRHSQQIVGDRLVLTGSCPVFGEHCRLDYQVRVPSQLPLVVRGSHGSTSLRGLSAPVRVEVEDGQVELARISADVELDLQFGRLRAVQLTGSSFDARIAHSSADITFERDPGQLTLDTRFSGVDVWMPADAGPFSLTSTSSFGDVDNQLRTDPASPSRIVVDNEFGSVNLAHIG